MAHCMKLYDKVRIDHFRGFDEYWSVPYGDETAENGKWEKGPGIELFKVLEEKIKNLDVIAEDLGFLTDSVRELLAESGYPGMKVLQFAFDESGESVYLPFRYDKNCIVYTGTHDNETVVGWYRGLIKAAKQQLRDYLCDYHTPDNQMYRVLIALTISALTNPAAQKAKEQLSGLQGCEAHFSVVLSQEDESF